MTDDDAEAQIAAACERIGQLAASIPDFPGAQTPAEFAAMAKAAGFGPVPERIEVTYTVPGKPMTPLQAQIACAIACAGMPRPTRIRMRRYPDGSIGQVAADETEFGDD